MSITMTIRMIRRRAEVTQNQGQAIYNQLEPGVHKCHVLGLFQVAEEGDTQPYFICEMNDGRNIYAIPPQVRFLDTEELNKEEAEEQC